MRIKILKMQEAVGVSETLPKIIGAVEYEISSETSNKIITGFCNLNLHNINKDFFIKYEDLTEDIVLEWIKKCIGEERLSEIEKMLIEPTEAQNYFRDLSIPWQK
jgi:hypothetical protein